MTKARPRPILVPPKPFRGNTPMPTGVSANSIGLDGRGSNFRLMMMIGIPLAVLVALAIGTWLAVQSLSVFGVKHLSNGTYTYSFSFYKAAEPVNLEQGEGLQYGSRAWAIALPTTDEVTKDCALLPGHWQNAFTVEVEGVSHPVCTDGKQVFFVTFYHGQTRHLFEVTYTSQQNAKQSDVRKFMESLKVTQE